ncbi:MAG: NUDIX hydrolase [Acidobacteriaceae bacterium]|nr:NUDIX hydrolase [Acidobacteriaceae bacterium]
MTHRNPWKTISSRRAYENAWIRVREDQVIRPDGAPGIYGVVEIRPSVAIVAIDDLDRVSLVGQWRYSVNRYSWEVPRGGSHPGETDMLEVARRELAEEAGVIAAQWRELGCVDVCNGVADDVQTLFLATGLAATDMCLDPEEEIVVEWRPFEEAVEMALDGRITEVCSIAAILKVSMLRNGGR